jgi:hypothetical protein
LLVEHIRRCDPRIVPAVEACRLSDLPFIETRPLDTSLDTARLAAAVGWPFRTMAQLCSEVAAAHFGPPVAAKRVAS